MKRRLQIMPNSVALAAFILGAVLILIAMVGGGFKLFGYEMSASISNKWLRFFSFFLGTFILAIAIALEVRQPLDLNSDNSPPVVEETPVAEPSPVDEEVTVNNDERGDFAPSGPELSSNPSIRKYQVALKRDPDDAKALRQLAAEYTKLEQYNLAIPLLEQLSEHDTDNVNVMTELARLYLLTGQSGQEEKIYDQILLKDQNNILALTGKAEIRLQEGEVEKAKVLFFEAEKRAPTEKIKKTVRKIAAERIQFAAETSQE